MPSLPSRSASEAPPRMSAGQGADALADPTADVALALVLTLIDPAGLPGAIVIGPPGSGKSACLEAALRLAAACNPPPVYIPAHAGPDSLHDPIDWAATLATGRPAHRPGLLRRAWGGLVVAEDLHRLDPEVAALIGMALADARPGFTLWGTALAGEPLPAPIARRVAFSLSRPPRPGSALPSVPRHIGDGDDSSLRALFPSPPALLEARRRLLEIRLDLDQIAVIARWGAAIGGADHRLDLFAASAARALAALSGRDVVTEDDLAWACRVLAPSPAEHTGGSTPPMPPGRRRSDRPAEAPGPVVGAASSAGAAEDENAWTAPPRQASPAPSAPDALNPEAGLERTPAPLIDAVELSLDRALVRSHREQGRPPRGGRSGSSRHFPTPGPQAPRQRASRRSARGRPGPPRPGSIEEGSLALVATLHAALVRTALARAALPPAADQGSEAAKPPPGLVPLRLQAADLRVRIRRPAPSTLLVLAVDVSGSMGHQTLGLAKGIAVRALRLAYQRRQEVAVIAFAGRTARCLRRPTARPAGALAALGTLAAGGGTPLPAALLLALSQVRTARRRHPGLAARLVLLTDGRANVPLAAAGGGTPGAATRDVVQLSHALRSLRVAAFVIDPSPGFRPSPAAAALAGLLGGSVVHAGVGTARAPLHAGASRGSSGD